MAQEQARGPAGGAGCNPYLFVVGCPRSGTTLLQRILDAHPQLAVTHEQWWIPPFYRKRVGLTPEGHVTAALIPRLFEHKQFPKLGLTREELEGLLAGGEPVAYARFVSAVYDLYARARGKPLAGDKNPDYVRQMPLLHGLWPGAKFVHLLRDGRDVCLSLRNWKRPNHSASRRSTWSSDPVLTAAFYWAWHVRAGREAAAALGPGQYGEVRYESLVARPREETAGLCRLLGFPFDEGMLRFHEGRTRAEPGLDAKQAWLPITPGLRDWQAGMAPADVELFEAAAGGLLDELGYPRAFPRPSPDAMREAARVRELFARDLRRKKEALPGRC
jgi:hypothetical protein